jgi:hypothetical protein
LLRHWFEDVDVAGRDDLRANRAVDRVGVGGLDDNGVTGSDGVDVDERVPVAGAVAGEAEVADLPGQLGPGLVADALGKDVRCHALVYGFGPAGTEAGDAEDGEGVVG